MLCLLRTSGFIESHATAAIRCMGNAAAGKALCVSDLDFYESQFGHMDATLASFLLCKHTCANTVGGVACLQRLLERDARPTPQTAFTFGDAVVQCDTVQGIRATIQGFQATGECWNDPFPDDWNA